MDSYTIGSFAVYNQGYTKGADKHTLSHNFLDWDISGINHRGFEQT